MKKRVLVFLVLATVAVGGAFAEWYDSYAEGIDASNVFINAGIGYRLGGGKGIPPITVSADFKLPIKMPITLGAMASLSTDGPYETMTGFDPVAYKWTYGKYTLMDIGIGARAMYHFGFLKNLDTYAGVTLGYTIQTSTGDAKDWYKGVSYFLWGAKLGGRYFFTNNIGAYLELDYLVLFFTPSVGLSLKF
jgi:hypothetical protein